MANASGSFPKWPLGDGESGTMIGASAEVILADAYVKGVGGFDAEAAYQIMRAAAMDTTDPPGGRGGMTNAVPYMQVGYVPASVGSSASDSRRTIASRRAGLASLIASPSDGPSATGRAGPASSSRAAIGPG